MSRLCEHNSKSRTVTCPSTNWAWRRVTLLMCATLLSVSHRDATNVAFQRLSFREKTFAKPLLCAAKWHHQSIDFWPTAKTYMCNWQNKGFNENEHFNKVTAISLCRVCTLQCRPSSVDFLTDVSMNILYHKGLQVGETSKASKVQTFVASLVSQAQCAGVLSCRKV